MMVLQLHCWEASELTEVSPSDFDANRAEPDRINDQEKPVQQV